MAVASDKVHLEIVDMEEFRDLARQYEVNRIPMTFFNHRDGFVGIVPEDVLVERLLESAGRETDGS